MKSVIKKNSYGVSQMYFGNLSDYITWCHVPQMLDQWSEPVPSDHPDYEVMLINTGGKSCDA